MPSVDLKYATYFARKYAKIEYSAGQKSPPPSNLTKSSDKMRAFLFYRTL